MTHLQSLKPNMLTGHKLNTKINSPKYLRKLTFNDVQSLYTHHANVHGYLVMLGNLNCLHCD